MKYQHAEALALAIHSCHPGKLQADGTRLIVDQAQASLFCSVVDTVAAFVEAQPTLYGGQRFADVAFFGKPTTQPANAATLVQLPSGLPGTLTITDTDDAPDDARDVDPKAEAKARRRARAAKRQAEADAALLAAMVASTGQSAVTMP